MRPMSTTARRDATHRLCVPLLVALAVLARAGSAVAQSISDPMPWFEVCIGVRERGAPLDDAGWSDVRAAYGEYLAACALLRTGPDAEWFHEDSGSLLWRAGGAGDGSLKAFLRAADRQRRADETFVERIIEAAGEDGQGRAPYLRAWCERRFLLSMSFFDRSSTRYVPGQLRRAPWTCAEDAALVRSAVDDLEVRLVAMERKRHGVIAKVMRDWADAQANTPPRPDRDDEEAIVAWHRDRDLARRHAVRPLREIEAAIDRAVDDAFTSLVARLSPAGRRVAYAVMQSRFDDLENGDPRGAILRVRAWLASDTLPDSARRVLREEVARWRDADDRLQADWYRAARRWAAARFEDLLDPMADGSSRHETIEGDVAAIAERRGEATEALVRLVHSSVFGQASSDDDGDRDAIRRLRRVDDPLFDGLGYVADAEEGWADDWDRDGGQDEGDMPAGTEVIERGLALDSISTDAWIDPPPTRESLLDFLDRCGAAPDLRLTAASLHDDFLRHWCEAVEPLRAAARTIDLVDSDGQPDRAAPQRVASAARLARDAAREAERSYFDSLRAIVPDECGDAVAVWQVSEAIGQPTWCFSHRSGFGLSDPRYPTAVRHANVARAVQVAPLDTDSLMVAERLVAQRAPELLAATVLVDESECELLAVGLEVHGLVRGARRRGVSTEEMRAVYDEAARLRDRSSARCASASGSMAAQDAALRRELESALPADVWEGLERTLHRIMYPGIDGGRRHHERVAMRALDVVEADPDRAGRIVDALDGWSARYEALTDELGAIGPEPQPRADGSIPTPRQHDQRTRWIMFEREQANFMLLHSIALAVTDEERLRLPRLPLR